MRNLTIPARDLETEVSLESVRRELEKTSVNLYIVARPQLGGRVYTAGEIYDVEVGETYTGELKC